MRGWEDVVEVPAVPKLRDREPMRLAVSEIWGFSDSHALPSV